MQGYSCGFGVRYIVWTNYQWCSTFYKKKCTLETKIE